MILSDVIDTIFGFCERYQIKISKFFAFFSENLSENVKKKNAPFCYHFSNKYTLPNQFDTGCFTNRQI